MTSRVAAIVLVAVLVVATAPIGTAAAAAGNGESTQTQIDADHRLVENSSVSTFRAEGVVTAELDQVDGAITIAETKADVGLGPTEALTSSNVGNDFVRIQYREDISRTLRIWIPAEYASPYERRGVESVSSDHVADLDAVRERTYLQIIVYVDGPADIVIPVGQVAGPVEGYVSQRMGAIETLLAGYLGSDEDWTYVDGLSGDDRTVDLEVNPETAIVQFDEVDQTGEDPDPRWINVPEGDVRGAPVYYHVDRGNESMYLVINSDEEIDIRYKPESSIIDEARGAIADARAAAEAVPERLSRWFPENPFNTEES